MKVRCEIRQTIAKSEIRTSAVHQCRQMTFSSSSNNSTRVAIEKEVFLVSNLSDVYRSLSCRNLVYYSISRDKFIVYLSLIIVQLHSQALKQESAS